MRFQLSTLLDMGAGAAVAYTIVAMNSPFDPVYSVGGGTCTGFAQWIALYQRYFVKQCKIQQTIWNVQAGTSANTTAFMLPVSSTQASAGVVPTIDMIMESQDASFATQNVGQWVANGQLLSKSWNPAKFEGLPVNSNYDDLSGYAGADPVIQPAVYCGFVSNQGGLDYQAVQTLLVEYVTELWRPTVLSSA